VKAPLSGAVGHIMLLTGSIARACAALALLAACAAGPVAAEASTPALIWRDVARINVLCLVQTEAGVDRGALHDLVCDSVREAAAAGSPAPVALIEAGDPAVLAPDSGHPARPCFGPGRRGQTDCSLFSIRPFRNSERSAAVHGRAARGAVRRSRESGARTRGRAARRLVRNPAVAEAAPAGARPIR
jgi:hypothetical protein